MSKQHRIDDLFKQGLGEHTMTPPPHVWNAIKQGLPNGKPLPFYKTPPFWAGAAIVVLFVGLNIAYWNTQYHNHINLTSANVQTLATGKGAVQPSNLLPPSIKTNADSHQQNDLSSEPTDTPNLMPKSTKKGALLPQHNPNKTSKLDREPLTESINKQNAADIVQQTTLYQTTAGLSTSDDPQKNSLFVNTQREILAQNPSLLRSTDAKPANTQHHIATTRQLPQNSTVIGQHASEENTSKNGYHLNLQQTTLQSIALLSTNITNNTEAAEQIPNTELTTALSIAPSIIKAPKQKTSGLLVNAFYTQHQSWILSKEGMENSEYGSLTNTLSLGNQYGIGISYDISKRWGITTEWTIRANQAQNFNRTNNDGTKETSSVALRYTHINLMGKYLLAGDNRKSSLSLLAGIQYGRLHSAAIGLDNPAWQELLQKHTWGFAGGLEYNAALSRHWFAGIGLRGSIGTASQEAIDLRFPTSSSTNNLMLGLKGGLSYRF